MSAEAVVREATRPDVAAVVPIWAELMEIHARLDPFFTCCEDAAERFAEYIVGNITKDNWHVLVAEADGQVVGYLQGSIETCPPILATQRYGNVHDMAVTAAYRRRGVGRKLVRQALAWFRSQGVTRFEVSMSIHNRTARAFWQSLGFEPYLQSAFVQHDVLRPSS
ncbi:MAG TPA: GNAT family N-acetyltransferase [Phycisphaerales bacterium]|mgnify:CR=1 FL=1|nr:GNAT family N-acetyltransferase [Phycisphaerales bacterium]